MSARLKIIASALGILWFGGVIAGIAIGKTHNSSPTPLTTVNSDQGGSSATTQTHSTQVAGKGKCNVVDARENSIFSGLRIFEDEVDGYTVIYCEEDSTRMNEEDIIDKWTGLFPVGLFKNNLSLLNFETSFDLKMTKELSDKEGNNYKITISSDQYLDEPIVATWDKTTNKISEKSVATAKVISPKTKSDSNIYLLFDQEIK